MATESSPYLGLALSGGTLKAAAHVGVLNALEKIGVQPDAIAGTSAGSLVSALYAHGYRSKEFACLLESFPGARLIDYGFPMWSSVWSWTVHHVRPTKSKKIPYVPSGLLRGRKLMKYIERLLAPRRSMIPLYIVATDLISGLPVVFTTEDHPISNTLCFTIKDIPRAITGSCALPGIFTPVVFNDLLLVDGAMRDYVPVKVLHEVGCKKIIAVNLYRLTKKYEPTTLVDVLSRSFDILLRESIDNDITPGSTTYVLEPDLSEIKWRRFSQMNECVEIGRKLVEQKKDSILAFARQ
ncbi:patatin-like phospholipase family protein [Alicyclobacillus dauci]|uniref:Patatin-like phospholipase family protein n=1 Tax=Alicyclobacillus dauci TaxID=1475485 RepID=A0ABY6YX64_9BACL|nr:patatin-like phospholipase family protein [Alicyclobacillus dauci]WAH35102.1 patatin-like phospholipase family protein [Alicyclobacillus dauci]